MSSIFANVFKPQFRAADLSLKQINAGLFGFPLALSSKTTLATENTALTLSAFYNAIDILSSDIAKLPKSVFKKEGDDRKKHTTHPINYLLSTRPNEKMTPYDFWKTIEILRLLKGNAFAEIIRSNTSGIPVAWYIRENKDVKVLETDDKLYYDYKGRLIDSADMLHFKGFSLDGKVGVGVVTYAATQLGVSLEAQAYGTSIYKNRGLSYGVIESDKPVEDGNKKAISEGFTAKLSEGNVHKAPVLDEGLKYKSIAITPAEAQFLETNKNGIIEVCRWLNIAPHKLKDLSSANYSNIYQQSIEHVQDSVLPRVTAKEQELNYKCFTGKESGDTYVKFNIAALLRGDLAAKSQFYTAMIYSGAYTRNEVRGLEDMNPIKGLEEPLQPVNMQALSMANELIKQQQNGNPK
jgi:HK97 family phage portal protein